MPIATRAVYSVLAEMQRTRVARHNRPIKTNAAVLTLPEALSNRASGRRITLCYERALAARMYGLSRAPRDGSAIDLAALPWSVTDTFLQLRQDLVDGETRRLLPRRVFPERRQEIADDLLRWN
jgi:hypothetical protein